MEPLITGFRPEGSHCDLLMQDMNLLVVSNEMNFFGTIQSTASPVAVFLFVSVLFYVILTCLRCTNGFVLDSKILLSDFSRACLGILILFGCLWPKEV